MVTQRKPKASKYLTTPTRPVQVDRDRSVAGLLEKMEGAGFGGRQMAEAHRIWLDMLGDNTTIIVAGSGALIPAGDRKSTRLNSSHLVISYAVFCLKKKN